MFRCTRICNSHNVTQYKKFCVVHLCPKKLIVTPETQKSSSTLVYFSCKMTVRGDLKVSLLKMDGDSKRVKLNFLAFQHEQICNEKFWHCSHINVINFFKYKTENGHIYMQNIKPNIVSQPFSYNIQIVHLWFELSLLLSSFADVYYLLKIKAKQKPNQNLKMPYEKKIS